MNYITSIIASSILSKVTRPTMDKCLIPINNIIKPITSILTTPFKGCSVLKGLIYSSKTDYYQVGNSFLVMKSNSNSFIQYIIIEKITNFIGYLNNIIFSIINIVNTVEDCELHYEYEYIYSLSDCIINKEEHSSDFRLKENGSDIILLSNLFNNLDDYNIERFLLKNQNKMLWDIKKTLYGISCNGYEYGKMEWSDIVIHNNNFKLVVSDELKQPLGNVEYDNDWVNFIMLYNTGICNNDNKIKDNRERQDLVQLLKRIDYEKCVINTIVSLENTNIYRIDGVDEMKYLMNGIDLEEEVNLN